MARQPRVRDYRAEEAARNLRAQQRGFRNRYEERALREGGKLPSAQAIATDPKARRKARELGKARAAGYDSYDEYLKRRKAALWSQQHSRQEVSRYDPGMSKSQFRDYYNALVRPWGKPREDRDKAALKKWIVDNQHHLTEREYDDSPRY